MECTNPRGCTLDSDEMVERVNAWRGVSTQALSREVRADRITSVYPADPALIRKLKNLIAAEAICCSFLKFSMKEERDEMVVELTFPEEARHLIQSVIAALGKVADAP